MVFRKKWEVKISPSVYNQSADMPDLYGKSAKLTLYMVSLFFILNVCGGGGGGVRTACFR